MVFDRTFSRKACVVGIGQFRFFMGRTPDGLITLRVAFTSELAWSWSDKQLCAMWHAWSERQSYAVLRSYCRKWTIDANRRHKHSGLRYELLQRVQAMNEVIDLKRNSMSIGPSAA